MTRLVLKRDFVGWRNRVKRVPTRKQPKMKRWSERLDENAYRAGDKDNQDGNA